MTDKKPSDELTELEPLDPNDLPDVPEIEDLPELPELPEVDELPELPDVAELPELPELADVQPMASGAKPTSKPAPQPTPTRRSAPSQPAPAARRAEPAPQPTPPARPTPAPPAKPAATAATPSAPRPAEPAPPKAPAPPPTPPAAPAPDAAKPAPLVEEPAPVVAAAAAAGEARAPEPGSSSGASERAPEGSAASPADGSAAGDASGPGADEPDGGSPGLAPGEKPPLRVLDKAPLHLKKAALIVTVGSLLPWMGHGAGVLTAVVGKALVLAGAWVWLKQIDHNWGPKLTGLLGKLGELELKPKQDGKKPARRSAVGGDRPTALVHSFPTGLHVLSLVLILAGAVAMPFVEGLTGSALGKAVAELGMLAWAAYTYVHIHSYERWGPFNPIFPMMFLAMLLGGLLQVAAGATAGEIAGFMKLSMMGGGLVVAIGGGLAAYTIVEAMMQAKKDGDAKKAAALEARRQARKKGK